MTPENGLAGSPLRFGHLTAEPYETMRYTRNLYRHGLYHTPLTPSAILVGLLLPIGDTLFATPALAALRRQFPQATITALVSKSNVGVLQDNPTVDRLILMGEHSDDSALSRFARSVNEIRQTKYDLIVNLSPAGALTLRIAGVYQNPLKVAMPALWWLIGGHSRTYRARHAVDHYLNAVAPILDRLPNEDERQPRIYLSARNRTAARQKLRSWGLSPANLLITMHVGGEGFGGRKRWATERFATVARSLIKRFSAHVLLLGGKTDIPLCEEVAALIPHGVTVVAGQTSLKETAALIEMSTLFIGNDSSPLHIAAAVGTPAVGIFGPSNVEQFHPIGKRAYRSRLLTADLPCSPCFHFIGNDAPWAPNLCQSRACLKAITPDQVTRAAVELLRDKRENGKRQ